MDCLFSLYPFLSWGSFLVPLHLYVSIFTYSPYTDTFTHLLAHSFLYSVHVDGMTTMCQASRAQTVKVSVCNARDLGSISGQGRSPGEGKPLHTHAWKFPWMEEPRRLQSMESQRVGHNGATSLSFSRMGKPDKAPTIETLRCKTEQLCGAPLTEGLFLASSVSPLHTKLLQVANFQRCKRAFHQHQVE